MAQFSHRPTSPHLPLIMIDTVDTVVLIMIDTVDTSINFPCIKQGMAGLLEVAALLLDRSCRLVDYAPCHAACSKRSSMGNNLCLVCEIIYARLVFTCICCLHIGFLLSIVRSGSRLEKASHQI